MDIGQLQKEFLLNIENSEYNDKVIVFGDGDLKARMVLVGEAPGGEEEKLGKPFVGKAGKNLEEFLHTLEIRREQLYITNVVKIRPTNISKKTGGPVNRPPNGKELAFFQEFLFQELHIIQPDLVITLGNTALKAVLGDKGRTIGDCHGTVIKRVDYNLFPLYHPASIIYNRGLKEIYDSDLMVLKQYIREALVI